MLVLTASISTFKNHRHVLKKQQTLPEEKINALLDCESRDPDIRSSQTNARKTPETTKTGTCF